MKVKTKYNLGEKVWFMDQNRPMCSVVRYVYIRVNNENQYSVTYLVNNDSTKRAEDTLYSSKQELLKTL